VSGWGDDDDGDDGGGGGGDHDNCGGDDDDDDDAGAIPMATSIGLFASQYSGKGKDFASVMNTAAILCTICGIFVLIVFVIAIQLVGGALTPKAFFFLVKETQVRE
jgi:hypothetical protein